MSLVRGSRAWAALLLAAVVAGCETTPKPAPVEEASAPATSAEFQPLMAVVQAERGEGEYPTLFAPTSYAVWLTPEVNALKREAAIREGAIAPWLDETARVVPAEYYVIECHLTSAFGDSSMAYDAVTLRGFDIYLETPAASGGPDDARRARPIQVLVDPRAQEGRQGALKTFTRTNLLVFAKQDLLSGEVTVPPDAAGARLVLDGHNTKFAFNWPSLAGQPKPGLGESAAQAVSLGFRQLYERLGQLAHMFD
jgi:hypothetical protein